VQARKTVRNARSRFEKSKLTADRQASAFKTLKRSELQIDRWLIHREKWLAVRRITGQAVRWGQLYDWKRKARLVEGVGTPSPKKLKKLNKKLRKKARKSIRKAKEKAKAEGLPYIGSQEHAKRPDYEIVGAKECGPPTSAVRAMLHTADAVEGALLKQADDLMVERHAAAAAAFAGREDRSAQLSAWLSEHPASAEALQKLLDSSGPFRIERWVAGLNDVETEAVGELAEWALRVVWEEKVKGVVPGAVGVRGAGGRVRAGLRIDRARRAVLPKLMYPQLSSIVDMAKVLGAQVPPPSLSAKVEASGVYFKKEDQDELWAQDDMLKDEERADHPALISKKRNDTKARLAEQARKNSLFKVCSFPPLDLTLVVASRRPNVPLG
jgi:hypothetical protein